MECGGPEISTRAAAGLQEGHLYSGGVSASFIGLGEDVLH